MTSQHHHLPYFYSDLFELGYEAVSEPDPRFETFCDWQEPFRKGVIYYLKEGRIRGVLLWNVWDQVEAVIILFLFHWINPVSFPCTNPNSV